METIQEFTSDELPWKVNTLTDPVMESSPFEARVARI